jgi:4-hydroxybenzoate polyprenyltransferase
MILQKRGGPIALIRLLRPQQWLKNSFLFAPLIFSRHLFELNFVMNSTMAFVVFSLVSSVVYVINDIADRESDRLHPKKRSRPIASGDISVITGLLAAAVLIILAAFLAMRFDFRFWTTALVYLALNLGYSFGLKQVVLVDVFVVASGFMLRVLAGVFAISVLISPWLVLCTLFVSVFLAVSKRRGEILLAAELESSTGRAVLRQYNLEFIDQMMTVAASGVTISYALYTVAERTVHIFGTENLIFTTVFVLFGVFRYLFLIRSRGTDDNPTHVVTSDAALIVNVIAWFASCVSIIYWNEIFHLIG